MQISSGDIFNENIKVSIIKQIKDFLKKFLKIDGLDESTDTKISKNLINSNLELARFIQEVKDNKIDDAKINRDNYLRDIKNVLKMLEDYEGSFFNKNQKLLETKNYLVAQNNSILKLLLAAFDDKRITESKIPLSVLLMSQKKGLDFINENIWQTDKENKVYRGRLDIASEGRYTCLVNSFTSNILPTKTYLNKDPSFLINNTQFFKEGSYPISIEYESLKITEVANLKIENIRELEIKGLGRGSYELSFNTEDIKSFLIVVFTNRKININNFGELLSNSLGENITFDYILPGDKVNANYEKNFFIDPISGENYYLYFIILEPYSTSLNEEVLKNLLIERNLEESDLNFYCVKTEERKKEVDKIEATKISNVEYKVKLPKNSSSKFLLFNQSYHDDWQAFSESNGEKLEHFRSGYGNAWYLPDNHDNEIKIVFSRQDLIIKNIFLSSILFFGLLFVFINKIKK
ncbi:MAG: hypothetical protein COU25_04050 [Candidatus Levybacteria bacterium CG10_big_fil_rev_8_21_14_0_10_35_13]|nr:MAG: hypothetical protein COU25_04050 [Candidatus Levybacteria bacterium CG10_big_fil_rev_8_21_14_0_10_35_13]